MTNTDKPGLKFKWGYNVSGNFGGDSSHPIYFLSHTCPNGAGYSLYLAHNYNGIFLYHPPGESLCLSPVWDPPLIYSFSGVHSAVAFWERMHSRQNFDLTYLKIISPWSYLIDSMAGYRIIDWIDVLQNCQGFIIFQLLVLLMRS